MCNRIHLRLRLLGKFHRPQTSGGFHTANAGCHTAFAGNFEQTDVASAPHMGATTQFTRRTNVEHTHGVAILLAKQHHGAGALCTFNVHDAGLRFRVGQNFFVHNSLNLGNLLRCHGAVVCKVEAGFFSVYQRALLAHMVAQYFAQRLVHQVGGAVITNGTVALVLINLRTYRIAHLQFTCHQFTMMAKHIGLNFLCVQYAEQIQTS